jgi:glycosyltransferase involved in cell wall biosynthesis
MAASALRPRIGLLATGVTAPRGTGFYARQLARLLPEVDPGLDFVIFCQSALYQDILPEIEKYDNLSAVVTPSFRSLGRVLFDSFRLPRLLKEERLDALHGLSFHLPALKNCVNIVTIHDLCMWACPQYMTAPRRYYLQWIAKKSILAADMIITDSCTVSQEIVKRFPQAQEKTISILLGADVEHTEVSDGGDYWLTLGADEPRKCATHIVQAYRLAASRQRLPDLVVVDKNAPFAEEMINGNCLKTLPLQSRDELQNLLAGASLLISASAYEGYNLPPHEALAYGVPVILSDIPVHREVYNNDALAFFPPAGVEELSTLFERLALEGNAVRPTTETVMCWRKKDWKQVATATAKAYRKALQ